MIICHATESLTNPHGRVHTAWRPCGFEMCRHVTPRFPINHASAFSSTSCCCSYLLLLLLLSRSAHGHASRLEISLPLRTARVPTIKLPSRGSAAAVLPSFRRDTTLPACSYAFTIGKFRRWWYSSPPCCTGGGRRLVPTGLSLCLALDDAGLHLNQLTHREQGPAPISSPMKLHQGLIFAFLL